MSCFRSSLSTTPVTSCCQTTGRIDASLRGQRAGGDRSLAVKLEPGDLSGDQAPIVFTPVELTCLRPVGYVQALGLRAATVRFQPRMFMALSIHLTSVGRALLANVNMVLANASNC